MGNDMLLRLIVLAFLLAILPKLLWIFLIIVVIFAVLF